MGKTHLRCLSPEHAAAVVAEATRPADPDHTVLQNGADVTIGYFDARYPLDVAEWAFNNGHCDDSAAGDVIERL